MSYRKYFDPVTTPPSGSGRYVFLATEGNPGDGDASGGAAHDEIVLAVNVAIATGRPLLLRGAPGCGKSSMARALADELGRTYYEQVVTSRSEARDLLSTFDAVRRLGDAQTRGGSDLPSLQHYVEPRALWWAFDPASAAWRGAEASERLPITDPGIAPARDRGGAVVLLDEIDKAEPDVPNDLLAPLGAGKGQVAFTVPETGFPVKITRDVLVVITTNEERDLPPAFLRRCVILTLRRPEPRRCVRIARAHFTVEQVGDDALVALATRYDQLARHAEERALRVPGTSELLDAVRACHEFAVAPGSADWLWVTNRGMWKHADEPPPLQGPG